MAPFLAVTFTSLWSLGCTRSSVVVGSKNFTEQVILGEMLALMLEERGLAVDRRLNLGGSFICHQALESGQMDVYVEYTGTAWTAILPKEPIMSDSAEVYRKVKEEYRKRFRWGPTLGFDNTYALAMRPAHAGSAGYPSDLRSRSPCRCDPYPLFNEFLEREDGFRGFTNAYGLQFAMPPAGWSWG